MNYSLTSKLNNFLIFVSQYMSLVFQFFKNQINLIKLISLDISVTRILKKILILE